MEKTTLHHPVVESDIEKQAVVTDSAAAGSAQASSSTDHSLIAENDRDDEVLKKRSALWRRVLGWGVEENGIVPVPLEKRLDERVANLFTVWFTALLCLLP